MEQMFYWTWFSNYAMSKEIITLMQGKRQELKSDASTSFIYYA